MPHRFVICEKSSQAKAIRTAVGTRFGPVLPAQGHIVELVEPDEMREEWKTWDTGLLWPGHFYPKKASSSTKRLLDAIRAEAKSADEIIIATDCDREGQLIGDEILDYIKFKGTRRRCIFNAEDPKTLQQAFSELKPNSQYAGLYASGQAREQADQTVNLSLTRTATVTMKTGGKGAIGIGRVKTPVLGIVCRRELEILDFKPQDLFEIDATVRTAKEDVVLTCARLPETLVKEKEKEQDGAEAEDEEAELEDDEEALEAAQPLRGRITMRDVAEAVSKNVVGFQGKLASKYERKKQGPPKLFDLTGLQSSASARFGWSGDRTLEVAQRLYSERTLITYPRAEAQYLPENNIDDVETLVPALLGLNAYSQHTELLAKPRPRKGKSGHFSDAALEGMSHYAIIPNVNVAENFRQAVPRLSEDEAKLFDMIARQYLAALAPDHEYLQMSLSLTFPWRNHDWEFRTSGRTPLVPGWRAITSPAKQESAPELPKIENGAAAEVTGAEVRTVTTRPPARYSEGALIRVMKEAWRLVDDPAWRKRLRAAKGIGTPATRGDIVKGLIAQQQILRKGKTVQPSQAGLDLYKAIMAAAPNLCDPGRTALWETIFDSVEKGERTAAEAVDVILTEARKEIEKIKGTNVRITFGGDSKPSQKLVDWAKRIAEQKGISLPRGTLSSLSATRAFLDEHAPKREKNEAGESLPSEGQLNFARRIAGDMGKDVPQEAMASAKALSAWIDSNKSAAQAARPPSEKQLAFAQKLADEKGVPIPDEGRTSGAVLSAWIDEQTGGSGGGKSKGGRKPAGRKAAPRRAGRAG